MICYSNNTDHYHCSERLAGILNHHVELVHKTNLARTSVANNQQDLLTQGSVMMILPQALLQILFFDLIILKLFLAMLWKFAYYVLILSYDSATLYKLSDKIRYHIAQKFNGGKLG